MPFLKQVTKNDWVSLLSFTALILSLCLSLNASVWFPLLVLFLAMGVSASVHNAEVIADRLGPSIGTIILAVSVTIIEVALIISLMGNQTADSPTIARDTVFAAIMIVTNGILGICILLGGLKYKELGFQPMGTSALLGVLAVLSFLTLTLPNFTTSTPGPTYSFGQLVFVSVASLSLYGALVWAQTQSHKSFFAVEEQSKASNLISQKPSQTRVLISFVGLIMSLIAVVGLAKLLSPVIESSIHSVGAPKAVVGIIIALLVLAPEAFAAMSAAKTNQLQTSLNLALGSGVASIALTIPAVSLYSLMSEDPLTLGLDAKGIIFLSLTFLAGSYTFASGKTTALHGLVHLVILASYLAISFMP